MKSLRQAIKDYIGLHRSLGFKLRDMADGLRDFAAFLEQKGEPSITTDLAMEWAMQPAHHQPRDWAQRLGFVRVFARHWSATDPRTEIPRRACFHFDPNGPALTCMRKRRFKSYWQPPLSFLPGRVCGFQSQSGEPERLAILSESAARHLWPGQNPLGRSLRLGTEEQFHNRGELLPDGLVWLVVGVARDTRGVTVDGSDSQQIYLPLPEDRIADYPVLVRTNSDPSLVIRAMGPAMSAVDPDLGASVSTLQDMLRRTDAFIITSTSAAVASTISLFGLILASMGIYSTISYMVVLRTREIGIRMAMGAQKRDILMQMIRESTRPVFGGLLVGMFFAAGGSLLLRRVLYGVSTIDAISFAFASLLFLAIALLASCPPAWRAMRVDPIVALRYE